MTLPLQLNLSAQQLRIIESPLDSTIFLSGPAGSGKTTVGVERMKYLVEQGVPGKEILIFTPQRNLSSSYAEAINARSFLANSQPALATLGGLARRTIELFWPVVLSELSLFALSRPPVFLTLESSIYFLSRIIEPLILDEGAFSSVTIQRNRLYSQILDNLNKSAVHCFPYQEISLRLSSSWIGEPSHSAIFQDAGRAAALFREYCLANNLLDYSLQIELLTRMISRIPLVKESFQNQYKHLIYDNVEEDVPAAHDFIRELFPALQSALVIYDEDAGYRVFLGASPGGGAALSDICHSQLRIADTYTPSLQITELNQSLQAILSNGCLSYPEEQGVASNFFELAYHPYIPQMVSWAAGHAQQLIQEGTPPEEIVVLSPFLSDSLRFLLTTEFDLRGIPTTTHRPSRALREEPAVNCLLTLAALAHPFWEIKPSPHELSTTLMQAIDGLDLTRSHLLAREVASRQTAENILADFEAIPHSAQERITFAAGSRYQRLINWLMSYRDQPPLALDHFLILIFGEVLSQPGFGFHNDFDMAETANRIIDSINKFRQTAGRVLGFDNLTLGREYYLLVKSGVLGNQYLRSWTVRPENAVLLAPAHTFLLGNYPVDYQFWLDVGSRAWHERIYQPLTNPYVLHRDWEPGNPWRDAEEVNLNQDNLVKIITGLLRRCRKKLYCSLTETNERGLEQTGLLIHALNKYLYQQPNKT